MEEKLRPGPTLTQLQDLTKLRVNVFWSAPSPLLRLSGFYCGLPGDETFVAVQLVHQLITTRFEDQALRNYFPPLQTYNSGHNFLLLNP